MDGRLTTPCWRAAILGIVLTLASVVAAVGQNTDYSIMSWAYGVVVWPDRVPADAAHFVDRLAAGAETAFTFWGYDPPASAEGWDCPTEYVGELHIRPGDLRIVEDVSDGETVVPSLQWMDRQPAPVVVIAFSGGWRMRDALGETATFGARFHFGSAAGSYSDAEDWIQEVALGHRTMICVSYAGDDILIHEFTHWFVVEWCEANGLNPWRLPEFIHEGMAEAACAGAKDPTDTAWEHHAVTDWAERNCLSEGVGAASLYTVGESLVTYLVGELGREGFLETLSVWASEPEVLMDRYEPGWRESLGLPRNCAKQASGHE